jgi:hypothetical protein
MAIGFEQSEYEIPQSRGTPPVVRQLFAVGLLVIFFMGFLAIRYAGDFHVWPSWDTVKVPLAGHF